MRSGWAAKRVRALFVTSAGRGFSTSPHHSRGADDLSYAMTMSRVAVRLFLALCLVLNGIGNAMAAVAMPAMLHGSAHAAMSMPQASPQPASACDAHHAPDDGATRSAPVEIPPSATQHPGACDKDCCAQGSCSCPCMQIGQAALLDIPVLTAVPGSAAMADTLPVGHPTPNLLNLIRPPIG